MGTTTAAGASFHVAIDLGAGSGRAMLGRLGAGGLALDEVHRFHYAPAVAGGRLRWSFEAILAGLKDGLRLAQAAAASRGGALSSVGVDSWGVDYGLLDAGGRLLEDPVCYRDHRTDGAIERVLRKIPREEIFHRTGIQFLQFNTLFQLHEHAREGLPSGARRLLLIPDLCHHALCGSTSGEYTNASTTQLLDVRTRRWADDLFSRLSLPRELMPEVVAPGTPLGELRPALQKELGLRALQRAGAGDPRHRQRGRRHAARARLGLRLVRDVVPGRRRADGAPGEPRGGARELHERGRRPRYGALPEERDGAVDLRLVPPRVGGPGRRERPRVAAGRRRRDRAPAGPRLPRPPALLQPAEHDRGGPGGARRDGPERAGRPGAADAGHPRLARPALRVRRAPDRVAHRRRRSAASTWWAAAASTST